MGVSEAEISIRSWDCLFCACREQLLAIQSYCKSQCKNDVERNTKAFESLTKMEIVQQMFLNYLQDAGSSVYRYLITRCCAFLGPLELGVGVHTSGMILVCVLISCLTS